MSAELAGKLADKLVDAGCEYEDGLNWYADIFAAGVDSCRPELARLRVELREARREIVEQRMEALHWESKLIDAEAALDAPLTVSLEQIRVEAAEVERKAAVLYGDPVSWCRGSGMNRSYWRRKVRRMGMQS